MSRQWAGFTLDRPIVMGILNITPDSFSDGGTAALDAGRAVEAGHRMTADGADIIDVGGESTRPGAPRVAPAEEQERVLPVVRALAKTGLVVSIDTRNAATMAAALDAGARIVNDVSGLSHDPGAAPLVAARNCPVVIMHMRGTPATMQAHAQYDDVVAEVAAELSARVAAAEVAGVRHDQIMLDPGIGFAKKGTHSIELLRRLPAIVALGYPLLVGLSRKAFIGRLSGVDAPTERVAGSVAGALLAVAKGASAVRVHDVGETVQALRVWRALAG